MDVEPTTLCRLGAWGQIGTLALAVAFLFLGMADGFLATCVGYLIVTTVGIVGLGRTESAIPGPVFMPFILPGFVPLYYFATQ